MKELIQELRQRGVRLRLKGEDLEFTAPRGAMTPELLRELRARKTDLRDWLLLESRLETAAPGDFDPDLLIAEALEAEGATGLGPEEGALREALGVYARSVEQDARPHGLGRTYLQERIFRMSLRARLRLVPHLTPGARPRRPPLVVCGLPRSGTTLLHRLLALADDAAGLPLWQLLEPLPPPRGPDLRREHAARNIAWLNGLTSVSLDAQHYVRPELADECAHLLRTAFVGSMPWQVPAYSWLEWTHQADHRPAYRVWAAFLALLEPEGQRLVLKDPFHTGHLQELLAVCPDAQVVQTHRDPVEVVPSFHKLCLTMHEVLVPELDRPRTVAAHTAWLTRVVEQNAAGRQGLGPRQLVDVDYRDLVADPPGEVARVHQQLGLPFTEAHASRIRAFMQDNGQRKHGQNPYSAEAYGQTARELAGQFADYRLRFGLDRPL